MNRCVQLPRINIATHFILYFVCLANAIRTLFTQIPGASVLLFGCMHYYLMWGIAFCTWNFFSLSVSLLNHNIQQINGKRFSECLKFTRMKNLPHANERYFHFKFFFCVCCTHKHTQIQAYFINHKMHSVRDGRRFIKSHNLASSHFSPFFPISPSLRSIRQCQYSFIPLFYKLYAFIFCFCFLQPIEFFSECTCVFRCVCVRIFFITAFHLLAYSFCISVFIFAAITMKCKRTNAKCVHLCARVCVCGILKRFNIDSLWNFHLSHATKRPDPWDINSIHLIRFSLNCKYFFLPL